MSHYAYIKAEVFPMKINGFLNRAICVDFGTSLDKYGDPIRFFKNFRSYGVKCI